MLLWALLFGGAHSLLAQTAGYPETFESGTKAGYAAGSVSLPSGAWLLEDALIGTSEADRKGGAKSVRLRLKGKLTMETYLPNGVGSVTVRHGLYGTDASSAWELWAMSEACACDKWTKVGPTVVTVAGELQTATFAADIPGRVRLEIRKVSGGSARINIDDVTVWDFGSEGPATQYPDNDHMALGNPSGAVPDVNVPANYLMRKPQYALSYHRDRGTPNWVSWHLDASDRGGVDRRDDFREDPALPAGWYRVNEDSYRGSGFDRGHNVPSADRTSSIENNSATFLMTNMIPQAPNNNQGLWADLENYTRTFLPAHEVYVIMGSYGVGGTGSSGGVTNTLDNGRVTVPARVWKVIVVLPVGDSDVSRIGTGTRLIAVDTPNSHAVGSSWGAYRTSVDAIEAATGLNLLSSLPEAVQAAVESRVDNGPTN
ncbi:DNA/RNA non-specific endonuclease [Sabulibacter ruber]|uniref:DNA/RNA non-specific endonuclease n=1 Tax=Sabulibacter ruber TaxID=2811901 RepID=UPI001F6188F8|nr:DNA/RNA non-specific endonuclease [Sabulibacter ruber]